MIRLLAKLLARPAVADWLIRRAQLTPYFHLQEDGDVYVYRWWLFNPHPDDGGGKRWPWLPSIRIHRIMRADRERHMHDHPWNARTFILRGWYREVRPKQICLWCQTVECNGTYRVMREAGESAALNFGQYHRITEVSDGGVWTLFVTGKKRGSWGFLVDGVKVKWREYLGISQ